MIDNRYYDDDGAYDSQKPKHARPRTQRFAYRTQAVLTNRATHVAEPVEYPCNQAGVDFAFHKQGEDTRDNAIACACKETSERKPEDSKG